MSLSSPGRLIIVGEEVGIVGVWLTGVEYHGPESTRHKVIGVEPKGVDAASGVNAADWSRRGIRSLASSQSMSSQSRSVVEGCR
jgi:hypothetical protein